MFPSTITSADDVVTLSTEARRALVPALMSHGEAHGTPLTLRGAHVALNLDIETDADLEPRYWFTRPNDVHPALDSLFQAARAGRVTTPTPATAPDTSPKSRDGAATALAVMRRRESMALSDRAAAETRAAELAAQVEALQASLAAVQRLDASASVPWGPAHPDWEPFWRQAAADAEAAGNCSEYDRHAREMGGPDRHTLRHDGTGIDTPRSPVSYDHTIRVHLSFDVTVTDDADASNTGNSEVVDAIRDLVDGGNLDVPYALDTWDIRESEPVDGEALGNYWNAP